MGAGVKVKVDLDAIDKIKLRHLLNENGKGQAFLTHEVRRFSDPYVPMHIGTLKDSAREETNCIVYVQPYAARQYYYNAGGNGLRGKLWDKRMMADHKKDVVDSVAAYVGGKGKT
ncbi:MAG: minor capsid protein [Oscillospiraceae bacterium]|nr:minor capsid protein [Oscillospiraceae bacterium]